MLQTYKYKALSKDGVEVTGVVEAYDEFSAVTQVKETCPVVLKITPVMAKSNILSMEIGSKRVSLKALSVMCSQFAIILKAGMPIATAVELIADQTEDKKLKGILEKVASEVAGGRTLASSFELVGTDAFPVTFFETIRAGESSGTLDTSFDALTGYFEKQYKVRQSISNALSYPIFVVVIAIVVMAIVMIKVIPTVKDMFSDLGGELPTSTKILIASSDFMVNNFLWIIAIVIGLVVVYQILAHNDKGRLWLADRKMRGPIFGKIRRLSAAGNFANTLSTLLKAGLPMTKAVSVTGKTLENYAVDAKIQEIVAEIEDGSSLGAGIRKIDYFPKGLTEMCAIGEQSGELEQTLDMIGAYYDNEADNASKKMLAKLEPGLMILLAIFAGFIVFSIYLPIFSMYDLM